MTSPSILRIHGLAFLVCAGTALSAFAQPGGARNGFELSTRYSHTGRSDLEAGVPPASVAVDSYQFDLRASSSLSKTTGLVYGLDWTYHELNLSGSRLLPGNLKSIAVPLGVSHRFDDQWRLLATASPRIAAASGALSAGGFDLPVLLLASYTTSPTLNWVFGVRYGARSDIKVLPLAGVAWKFSPGWEFRLAWPESGLSYRVTPQLTLRATAAFHGGDYRIDDDPREPSVRTGVSLDKSWLEYREVRLGLSAEYAIGRSISLRTDLGKVISQGFEYLDRDLSFKGGNPTYFTFGAVIRF